MLFYQQDDPNMVYTGEYGKSFQLFREVSVSYLTHTIYFIHLVYIFTR